jgi:hypothetical protein
MLYAQCEDDLNVLKWIILKNWDVSEIKGQSVLYNDLEIRLLIDVDEAKQIIKSGSLVKKNY